MDAHPRRALVADCSKCFGLCCVAPAFSASADFAIDKAPHTPCPNLRTNFACSIHDTLRADGFAGCTVYECFGAGQKVAQVIFAGQDWRNAPETASQMFAVFGVMRQLHEMLWYLHEAKTLSRGASGGGIEAILGATERLSDESPAALLQCDVAAHRRLVGAVLLQVSNDARARVVRHAKDYRDADLLNANLARANLRAANLRGACLIAADLRHADARHADLLAADLRNAQLQGTDLTDAMFLTQAQVNSALGDASTRLPPSLVRPRHWPSQALLS